ncbi:CgeB family protein [Fibrella forsythiae]|uniref:Glycosyltransferase n=1 Tax=Fibrella forsythiae TaxID=2817061 RepID=A0ABS3JTT8_9BACT|nr:glycosyltransferase [Fibrella forsythiae]MBO0952322.1 glycosyltransferase [Fibrella forsythiae]
MTIFMIGHNAYTSLECSYGRAFEVMGHTVTIYDVEAEMKRFTRLGWPGHLFNQYITVDAWRQKLNRDLALRLRALQPDLVLVFANARVIFSTLAYVKSLLICPFVLVWPDPLTSLQTHVLNAAPLYDGVATYCQASVPLFQRMGFPNPQWVPLAADTTLHGGEPMSDFLYDLTFVGAWRPEREEALATITRHFPTRRLGIWGSNWDRSRARQLQMYLHHKPLTGQAYATMFRQSRLNLNVIDDTCYPAANMRFFEIPVAGGLQLVTACPEMAGMFRDNEHVLYAADEDRLSSVIEHTLSHPEQAARIRKAGNELVHQGHTYAHRATQLIDIFL